MKKIGTEELILKKKMSNMFFEGRVGYFVANFEIELANLFNCFVKPTL